MGKRWVWGDGMESHWATVTKEGQWYVVTENATKFNIIFVNGSDWNGDANQTVDMEGITENTCFQLNQSGGGKVQYTIIDWDRVVRFDLLGLDRATRAYHYHRKVVLIKRNDLKF